MNPLGKVAAQCRQLLSQQPISATGPGTILGDVQTLIEFVGADGLRTKSKQGNLPAAVLPALNERLSQPITVGLNRPLLRDYPNIAGLYVLLRVMDIARAEQGRLWIHDEALARWSSLNPTEKYFALLEAWLMHAQDEVLGVGQGRVFPQFSSNLLFLTRQLSARWKSFDEYCHTYEFRGGISTWNTQLQARFGLIELQARPPAGRRSATRGWLMQQARRTPWGEAVAWVIGEMPSAKQEADWLFYQLPAEAGFGFFQPAFQPFFPAWQQLFAVAAAGVRKGLYVFHAAFDPRDRRSQAWRRLAVPGGKSLDALASAVLKAFDFDDPEHLYEFRYRDQRGKARLYYHPYTDEGPYADEITLDQTGLPAKGTMKFLFDFGDCWRFVLRLERIDPPDASVRQPRVIAAAGEPPEQYPEDLS